MPHTEIVEDSDSIRRTLSESIQNSGWGLIARSRSDGPGTTQHFVYTVGLTETFQHPELVLIGFEPEAATRILELAAFRVSEGTRFRDLSTNDQVIEGFLVAFRSVPWPEAVYWARLASERYSSNQYELLQLILPDFRGRFPWDAGCPKLHARIQERMPDPTIGFTDSVMFSKNAVESRETPLPRARQSVGHSTSCGLKPAFGLKSRGGSKRAKDLVESVRARVAKIIHEHGWAAITVDPTDDCGGGPKFAYTVGLTETYNHPEIVMVGFASDLSMAVLNSAGKRVKNGIRLVDWSTDDHIIQLFPVAFRSLPMPQGRRWAPVAGDRYRPRSFELLQMFMPDGHGRFPWNADCDESTSKIQMYLLESMRPVH